MERMDSRMWYAFKTEPELENTVRRQVRAVMPEGGYGDCRVLYCIRKKRYLGEWHDKRERFLPGYMFLVMDNPDGMNPNGDVRRKHPKEEEETGIPGGSENSGLIKIPGFSEMPEMFETFRISQEDGRLCLMGREEEEVLEKLTGGTDEIGMSYGVIRDGILEISDGVLAGMESRIRKIDRHKRKGYISMRINGEETMAEIGLEITEKT